MFMSDVIGVYVGLKSLKVAKSVGHKTYNCQNTRGDG